MKSNFVLMPTPELIESVVDEIVDAALEQELSFVERIIAAPFIPMVKSQVRGELEAEVRVRILEACFAASGAEMPQLKLGLDAASLSLSRSVFRAALGEH